jgi:16S rRNA (cytosine1402-N4)-methyltransferase
LNDVHVPVLCEETIDLVMPEADDGPVIVDATFGRGGHTRALLARLGPAARVIAVDCDIEAVNSGQILAGEDDRLQICHGRFSELEQILEAQGVSEVAAVIMDLGVSSPQLDSPSRGFSFRADGPIDMRMDQTRGVSAGEWLNRAPQNEIARVIRTFGEERFANRIARAIVAARPLDSTRQLAELVRRIVPRKPGRNARRTDEATRTFQAIRMQVNDELAEIEQGIVIAFDHLKAGGRLAIISFHSLEDALVKKTIRRLASGPVLPRRLPIRAEDVRVPGKVVGKPIRAGDRELNSNPRSRSATLRVLERTA